MSQAVVQHAQIGRPELEAYSVVQLDGFSIVEGLDLAEDAQVKKLLADVFSHDEMQNHPMISDYCRSYSDSNSECARQLVGELNQPQPIGALQRINGLLEYSSKYVDDSSTLEIEFAKSSREIKDWLDQNINGLNKSYEYTHSKDYVDQKCVVALSADHAWVICYEMDH